MGQNVSFEPSAMSDGLAVQLLLVYRKDDGSTPSPGINSPPVKSAATNMSITAVSDDAVCVV
jgi:hypothetical protein